ncbi:hypothetical protein Taro_027779 [Colocasia esculenta]|uniref:Uncharacterized protein n=1 Tax=Colocasia esculenta TaxID=4460 RepID=A0A843VGN7_COLES|nr:hypothetical protein [Colocasia esculenta]
MEQYLEEKKASQKRPAATFQRQDKKKAVYPTQQRSVAVGSSQVPSVRSPGVKKECPHCGKTHGGTECWMITGKCLKYGSSDHKIKDCPRLQQGVQRGEPAPAVAAAAPATGRPGRPRAPARVFALAREDAEQAEHVTEEPDFREQASSPIGELSSTALSLSHQPLHGQELGVNALTPRFSVCVQRSFRPLLERPETAVKFVWAEHLTFSSSGMGLRTLAAMNTTGQHNEMGKELTELRMGVISPRRRRRTGLTPDDKGRLDMPQEYGRRGLGSILEEPDGQDIVGKDPELVHVEQGIMIEYKDQRGLTRSP